MSRAISRKKIEDAILDGARNAHDEWRKVSGYQSLEYAPELFIQAKIFTALWGAGCPYVTLEDGVDNLFQVAGASRVGRSPRKGRVDIVVWWKKDQPRTLIEVKKAKACNACNADAKRVRQTINRRGKGDAKNSIESGYLVVYTSAKNEKTVTSRFEKIAENTNSRLSKPEIIYTEEYEMYWSIGVFSVNL